MRFYGGAVDYDRLYNMPITELLGLLEEAVKIKEQETKEINRHG